jgi:hypothetical protein
MAYLNLICKECGEDVEVYCDGDNAMMCPECRSIDCFTDYNEQLDNDLEFLKEFDKE